MSSSDDFTKFVHLEIHTGPATHACKTQDWLQESPPTPCDIKKSSSQHHTPFFNPTPLHTFWALEDWCVSPMWMFFRYLPKFSFCSFRAEQSVESIGLRVRALDLSLASTTDSLCGLSKLTFLGLRFPTCKKMTFCLWCFKDFSS